MFAQHPQIAERWAAETPDIKKLPEKANQTMSKKAADDGRFFEKRALPVKGRFFRDLGGRDDGMFMAKSAGSTLVNGDQPAAQAAGNDSSKLNVGATGAPMGGSGFRGQGMGGGMYGTGDGKKVAAEAPLSPPGGAAGATRITANQKPIDPYSAQPTPVRSSGPAKGFDRGGKYDPTAGQQPINPYEKSKENPTGGEKPKAHHHARTAKRATVADLQPGAAKPMSSARRAKVDNILASKNSSSADDPLDVYQASMGVTEKAKPAAKPAAKSEAKAKPATVRDLPGGSKPTQNSTRPEPAQNSSRREPVVNSSRREGAPWQPTSGWGSYKPPAGLRTEPNSSSMDEVNSSPMDDEQSVNSSPLAVSKEVKSISKMSSASPSDWDADTSLPTGFHRPAKLQPEALEDGGERFHSTEDGTVIPSSNRQRHGLVEGGSMSLRATSSPQMGKHASVGRFLGTSYGIEKGAASSMPPMPSYYSSDKPSNEATGGSWLGNRASEFGSSLKRAVGGIGDMASQGVKSITQSPVGATVAALVAAKMGLGGAKKIMRLGAGAKAAEKAMLAAKAAKAAGGGASFMSRLMGGAAKAVAGARNFVTK